MMKTALNPRPFLFALALLLLALPSMAQTDQARVSSVSYTTLYSNVGAPRLINTEVEPLAAVDSLGQVVFASRHGQNNGIYYVQSIDAGQSWTLPIGPITQGTPPITRDVSILLTPDAAGNPLLTRLEYVGSEIIGPGFVYGNAPLDNNPASSGQSNFPQTSPHNLSSGIARATAGQYYTVETLFDSTTFAPDSLVLIGNIPLSAAPITPWTTIAKWDLVDSIAFVTPKVAFSPDGMDGWIVALSNQPGTGADSNLTPLAWHSSDAGLTWTGPQEVDFSNWQCLRDSLQTGSLPVLPTTAFEFDLTVDNLGNPHILTAIMNRPSGAEYTVLPGARKWVVDISTPDQGNTWNGMLISPLSTFRGEVSNFIETYFWDHSFQIGRNPEGNRIFYLWTDTDTTGFNDPTVSENMAPDLFTAGFSLFDSSAALPKNWTNADLILSGKINFPHLAPEILSDTVGADTHVLPIVFSFFTSTSSPILGDRVYLPEITIAESDFNNTFLLVGDNICGSPCANAGCVWPGDAAYDFLVDMDDLLMLGINFDSTGPVRPNANIAWASQPGVLWPDSTAGINMMHSDCDGNGQVFWADTLAIQQNYSLVHSKTSGPQENLTVAGAPTLSLVPLFDSLQVGQSGIVEIRLGDSLNPADSIYGLRYTFNYDPSLVDTQSVHVSFSSSWMGNSGSDLIGLYQDFYFQGQTDIGMVRTDQMNSQGFGPIARVSIVAIDNISGKRLFKSDTLHFGLSDVRVIDVDQTTRPTGILGTSAIVWDSETQIYPPSGPMETVVQIWPNPAKNQLNIIWAGESQAQLTLVDMLGRPIRSTLSTSGNQVQWGTAEIPNGQYLLRIEIEGHQQTRKVLIQH